MTFEFSLANVGIRVKTPDGKVRQTLQDVSLAFRSNERIGLLGRNGSGKTSLARILARVDNPTTGKLSVLSTHARVLLVLQRPEDHFVRGTVGEQINSYAHRALDPQAVHELLQRVGLPVETGRWPPRRLSTGQQRLVAIACALASQAPFLVLDEPMAGLDARGRNLVKQALGCLDGTGELGYVIISHHPDDLLGLVARIWVLDNGQLIHDGPFEYVSLNALDACLSAKNSSLYYWMRQQAEQGKRVPESAYHLSDPESIAASMSAEGLI